MGEVVIQNMRTNGMHFPINNMSNEELVLKIDEYLISVQKSLSGRFCLYLNTFNIVKHHIDFKEIQKECTMT